MLREKKLHKFKLERNRVYLEILLIVIKYILYKFEKSFRLDKKVHEEKLFIANTMVTKNKKKRGICEILCVIGKISLI